MTGKEKSSIITQAIHKLRDVNVRVLVVTCDGPQSHMAMIRELGGSMKWPDLQPSFPDPTSNSESIALLLDPCHMLKLIRGTLFTYKDIKNKNGI